MAFFRYCCPKLYAFQKRGKGRPKRKRDLDDYALAFMVATSYITGETSTSKLAAAATDAGLVRKTGSHATRVDELARKYAAYKRKPRSLNLDGGKYDDAKILLSDWLIVKMCAWRYAATKEPHLIMERARDFAEFLRGAAPNIEQEFESDEEWGFMNRPFPTVEK